MNEYVYEDVRQEFMQIYEDDGSQTHNLQVFFNTLKRLEDKYNTSLEAMNWEQFVQVLIEASGISYTRYRQNVVYARKYIYWLKECDKISRYRDNIERLYKHFQDLSKQHLQVYQVYDLSDNYKKLSWGSPEDLGMYLNEVFQPISANTTDNQLRLFIWLLYMGFNPIDAVRIKKTDVHSIVSMNATLQDTKKYPTMRRIVYNNMSSVVPNAALTLFQFMLQQNSIEVRTKKWYKTFQYDDPQRLIGTYSYQSRSKPQTDEQIAKTMAHRLSMFYVHNIDDDENRLTTNNIVTAGMFYDAYNNKLNDSKKMSTQRVIIKRYGNPQKMRAITGKKVNQKYSSERKLLMEQEYRSWEKAFH